MKLQEQGVECTEIYGDPALLLPPFYKPIVAKCYREGIIPRYRDIDKGNVWVERHRQIANVLIIDIESDIEEFVCGVKFGVTLLSS